MIFLFPRWDILVPWINGSHGSSSSLGKSVGDGHLGEASNLGSSHWATKMMRGDFKGPEL